MNPQIRMLLLAVWVPLGMVVFTLTLVSIWTVDPDVQGRWALTAGLLLVLWVVLGVAMAANWEHRNMKRRLL